MYMATSEILSLTLTGILLKSFQVTDILKTCLNISDGQLRM